MTQEQGSRAGSTGAGTRVCGLVRDRRPGPRPLALERDERLDWRRFSASFFALAFLLRFARWELGEALRRRDRSRLFFLRWDEEVNELEEEVEDARSVLDS